MYPRFKGWFCPIFTFCTKVKPKLPAPPPPPPLSGRVNCSIEYFKFDIAIELKIDYASQSHTKVPSNKYILSSKEVNKYLQQIYIIDCEQ